MKKPIEEYPHLMTTEDVAEVLGNTSAKQVSLMCQAKKIPSRKVGGKWRIRRDLFWEWLSGDDRKAG